MFPFSYSELEVKCWECFEPVLKELNLNIYDIKISHRSSESEVTLFVFNKETDTAGIEDCVNSDRALTPVIEDANWLPERLTLQVSSPGLEREIRTVKQAELSIGKDVKVRFCDTEFVEQTMNKKWTLEGKLKSINEKEMIIENKDSSQNLPLDVIKKVQRTVNW